MVRGWLVSLMVKEIKNSVKYATTDRDIWTDLNERFNKDNAPRAYELRRILTTTHQGNLTVSAYYTKPKGIWDEIQSVSPMPTCTCNNCTCGIGKSIVSMRDKDRLYDFLMGLNEDFSTVRTQILSSDPILTVGAAFHLVSQDEHQRATGNYRTHNTDATTFLAYGRNPRVPRRQNNQHRGKTEEKECTYCQKTGHTVDGYFELIGYPDWWSKKTAGLKNQTNRFKINLMMINRPQISQGKILNICYN
ncbi:uncharacterized protein [Rutidosis leptorrhynchoides]|uniref:uncharacterized protein n=1 Tax=Rutidosis leptorrhynchoides TaxID=125765 RepID=UPI003A9997CF